MLHLDWGFFSQDIGNGTTYLQWLFDAWGWTLTVAAGAWLVALILGVLVGVLWTVPNRTVSFLAQAWVEVFRNIPVLVQFFVWYHVVPALIPHLKSFPTVILAILALGYFTSARVAVQVRAGLSSLSKGQRMAGQAMGLTLPQTYRYVLLPMALRIVLPPLTSESMNIIKNSSVAYAVGVPELILYAQQVQEETARGIETYLVVTALYFLTAFLVSLALTALERKLRVPGYVGGK